MVIMMAMKMADVSDDGGGDDDGDGGDHGDGDVASMSMKSEQAVF